MDQTATTAPPPPSPPPSRNTNSMVEDSEDQNATTTAAEAAPRNPDSMAEDSEGRNGTTTSAPAGVESEKLQEIEEEEAAAATAVGPGPAPPRRLKRPLQFEQTYLDSLPSANMYEKSYMHRDIVTHVAVSAAEFFITGSCDGHLKFWKKKPVGIEFAKHFRSHLDPIEGLSVSADGLLCCTISNDRSVKVYDVVNFDMMVMIRLSFVAGAAEWVYKLGDVRAKLAISDRNSSFVHIYDVRDGSNEPIISKEIHLDPIKVMKYIPTFDTVVSADTSGMIEYWNPSTLQFPESGVKFKFKTDSDLLEVVKCKTTVSTMEVSPDGKQFSVTSPDRRIRVFWYRSGKLRRVYDESLEMSFTKVCGMIDLSQFQWRMLVQTPMVHSFSSPQLPPRGWITSIQSLVELVKEWM
ncbi:hypothetical protein Droror1_Dr00003162 [Drosera rotundifolia]